MCFSAVTLQRRSILISEKCTYRDGYIEEILPDPMSPRAYLSMQQLTRIHLLHAHCSERSIYNDMHGLRPPLSSALDTEHWSHLQPRRVLVM